MWALACVHCVSPDLNMSIRLDCPYQCCPRVHSLGWGCPFQGALLLRDNLSCCVCVRMRGRMVAHVAHWDSSDTWQAPPPPSPSADMVPSMSLMTPTPPPPIIPPAIQSQSSAFTAFLLEVWDRLTLPTRRPQRQDKSMTPEVGGRMWMC